MFVSSRKKMDIGADVAPEFSEILSKAWAGEELSVADGERLLRAEGGELHTLVRAADEVRSKNVGEIVTYVINRNINHTNICAGSCKFCAFRRSFDDPDAYMLTHEQIAAKVREAIGFGATEVCIQGGLRPDFGLKDYIGILRAVRDVSSSIHIHAFSPSELDNIAMHEGLPVEEVIETLRDAGLNSVPGTAAEILIGRVREIICPKKIPTSRWVEIIKTCHRLGVPTTATMMYGHVETLRERAQHLSLIREIQRETRGFTEFVLLPFMFRNTQLWRGGLVSSSPSVLENLRVHAVSRLMLAGFINNIQTSWVKLGPRGAQLMLTAGANDLGGTLFEENISRAAGVNQQPMTSEQLEQLILELGRVPRQRTTTYKLLE